MRMVDLIYKKRDGFELTKEEIAFIVKGFVKGEIPDYQISAFLMAVCFRHMTEQETFFLTQSMEQSGQIMDLSSIQGIKVDKHSTGGVGDKTTIVVAPIVASCGVKVAKLSGRGLGHTGGTIDKLESIPGFRTSLSFDEWVSQVNKIGIAIAGGNETLVPADKKIYALRDVTATIEEVSLIASSIMSKKLASGSDAFVLDVKNGSGAFMKSLGDARVLGTLMVKIATLANKKACAFLTNMDIPLGKNIGNALEIIECVETLKGNGAQDLTDLCLALSAKMVEYGISCTSKEAETVTRDTIKNGKALSKFREFVEAQGGDSQFIDNPWCLMGNVKGRECISENSGWIERMNTEKIGRAAMVLGAGRVTKESVIDPAVGIVLNKKTGDRIQKGDKIADIYYSEKGSLEEALRMLNEAIVYGERPVSKPELILDVIA